MAFGFARSNHIVYQPTLMVQKEFSEDVQSEVLAKLLLPSPADLHDEHRHGDFCACQLRGE